MCPNSSPYPIILGGLEGTHLVDVGQTQDWICDDTEPICQAPLCSVDIAQFTTRTNQINYNFRGFYDDESGILGSVEPSSSRPLSIACFQNTSCFPLRSLLCVRMRCVCLAGLSLCIAGMRSASFLLL